ncbi:MAG: hypothetical protein HY002_00210 [Candidatus Rokubacteria bacterium]|nr:hypothetical protein [Candidatus Rokubacteria bacterium]
MAATCLHIAAQSGHEHSKAISLADGNRPVRGRISTSMTARASFPCRSSTSEPIFPAHSLTTARQRGLGKGVIATEIR